MLSVKWKVLSVAVIWVCWVAWVIELLEFIGLLVSGYKLHVNCSKGYPLQVKNWALEYVTWSLWYFLILGYVI